MSANTSNTPFIDSKLIFADYLFKNLVSNFPVLTERTDRIQFVEVNCIVLVFQLSYLSSHCVTFCCFISVSNLPSYFNSCVLAFYYMNTGQGGAIK